MIEDRLNGFALLYIHAEIDINVESIIERLANQRNRRLEFFL